MWVVGVNQGSSRAPDTDTAVNLLSGGCKLRSRVPLFEVTDGGVNPANLRNPLVFIDMHEKRVAYFKIQKRIMNVTLAVRDRNIIADSAGFHRRQSIEV